jgi:sulfane dehydrogenase subunit SoxC
MVGTITDKSRRRFLYGLGGTLLAGRAAAESVAAASVEYPVPADPSKVFGHAADADGGYGLRSQFAKGHRLNGKGWSLTPLQDLYGTITPSGLHYGIHHGGIPTIDPDNHSLTVHGMVDRAIEFSMADILRFPRVSRIHFLECAGNTASQWMGPKGNSVQYTHDQISNTEWTGVPLATILREAGLAPGASWVIAEGGDAAVMSRSLPLAKCLDDTLLVFGQNGEELRPEQGFPLRLIVPGFEGNTSIKWLRRLQVTDRPYMTRMETRGYTDLLPSGKARQFTFVMEAKSVIDFPSAGMALPNAGFYEITGLAWSGRGRIVKVEVSVDGGASWHAANLEGPILTRAFTRFRLPWTWSGQAAVLQSRCSDETGYVQPTLNQLRMVRGLNSVDHNNAIQSWQIDGHGEVSNVQV